MTDKENNQLDDSLDLKQVGLESLKYHPSKVSWAMSQHISRENPKIHRLLVYVVLSIIVLSVVYSLVTKVAISLKANGKLDYDANTLTIVNNTDLVIDKIFFKDSDQVKKNDLLLVGKKQLPVDLAKKILQDGDFIVKNIDIEKQSSCSKRCLAELEKIFSSGLNKNAGVQIEGDLEDYFRQLNTDLSSYILSLKNVGNEGVTLSGLRLRLSQATSKLNQIKKKNAQNLLAMEVENLNKEIADLNSQINEKKIGNTNQIATSRSTLMLNLRQLKEKIITYRKNHEIRSPAEGILKFESIGGAGELISARTKVFRIIPSNSDLVAKITIQNKDISEIEKGGKVKIAIQALPEREYGAVYGTIQKIAVAPIENKETGTLNYEVIVAIEKQKLQSNMGDEKSFKLGMILDAKVITKHKTLFWVGISKLLNIKQEYLGELF